jgi:V/A-type H+-transporting ATPase subunit G/H
MELIKKIKEAETEAQRIIEQAKKDATESAQNARQAEQQALEQAESDRKKTIESAIAAGQKQGQAEAAGLKVEGQNQREELRDKAKTKMNAAVASVMEYLRK